MDDITKLTLENVNKINGIAGNLMKWVKAQLQYGTNVKIIRIRSRI